MEKKEKARLLKRRKIYEHNERVERGWTDEDLTKKEQLLQTLEMIDNDNGMSTKKKANNKRRIKNDLKKLELSYQFKDLNDGDDKPSNQSTMMRSRRVKVVCTNKESEDKLNNWIGTTRWVYNQCVAYSREHPELFKMKTCDILRSLRDNIESLQKENSWLVGTPYDIRDEGVRDFVKAWSSNMAKMRKKKLKNEQFQFKIGFRSKNHALRETITIQKKHWGRGAQKFLISDFKSKEGPLPDIVNNAVRITKTRIGWYFSFSKEIDIDSRPWSYSPHDIVALDPGVRTFMTGYFVDGVTIEWGAGDMKRIYALLRRADQLHSKTSKGATKYRRPWLRLLLKIRYKIDEVHRKFATFLCRVVKTILLPKFDTSRMVMRAQRSISSKTSRSMMNWGHYRFRETLKAKASLFGSKCRVIICDEHFTSKTCGACGVLNNKLGASKTFNCPSCGYRSDRDINGARNILLRYLTLECINIPGGVGPPWGSTFAPTGLGGVSPPCMRLNSPIGSFSQ